MPRLNLLTEEVNENNSQKKSLTTYDLNDQILIFKLQSKLELN
jgi:hypothetical protein